MPPVAPPSPQPAEALPLYKLIGGDDFNRRRIVMDSFGGGSAEDLGHSNGPEHRAGTAVFTWGMGYQGQLGGKFRRGEPRTRSTPTRVALPDDITAIRVSCGGFHTAVLADDGRVFTWGEGKHGQLGYPCVVQQDLPTHVMLLSGDALACALFLRFPALACRQLCAV